ncbi:hypothetical protein MMC17_009527 [Xylographa soralifera]|nr:hypothetical protein [Xylographa soralifera]
MGLSGQQNNGLGPKNTFSEDILSLEVCGPDEEHLSVIDVPGIFKKTTQGVTTRADMHMVKTLVHTYIKNSRSVMLTVAPANVDITTQEILDMAEEADPEGQRTLGVLTKPDLVDKGAEKAVTDLIDGKRHQLSLGWCLVRNPGQQESSDPSTDRHSLERDFFTHTIPWNTLEKDRVGIPSLQARLRKILTAHIRREFPKASSFIQTYISLMIYEAEIATTAEQSRYLIEIATRFQEVTALALGAKYGADDLFDNNPSLRLATAVVNRNEVLSEVAEKRGHTYEFKNGILSEVEKDELSVQGDVSSVEDDDDDDVDVDVDVDVTRLTDSHPELEDIMHETEGLAKPIAQGVRSWLTKVYRTSRGFELGTFDSSLLAITMKSQSSKWNGLALGYISDIVTIAHSFIFDLLRLLCPNERVRSGLISVLMDELVERYKKAFDQIKFILHVERTGTPMTLNHYFNDNLENCRQERVRQTMKEKSFDDCSHGTVVRLDDIITNRSLSNVEHVVQDLHDILRSYYKVSRKRFVDIVCMQGADYHVISGPLTPLKLFSPAFVGDMTVEQLAEIAGEDAVLKQKRERLRKEIEDLETGKKIMI